MHRRWKRGSDMSIVLLQPPHDHHHIYYDTDYGTVLMEDISQCARLLMGPPSESFTRYKQDKQANKQTKHSPCSSAQGTLHCSSFTNSIAGSPFCTVQLRPLKIASWPSRAGRACATQEGRAGLLTPNRKKVILVVMR